MCSTYALRNDIAGSSAAARRAGRAPNAAATVSEMTMVCSAPDQDTSP